MHGDLSRGQVLTTPYLMHNLYCIQGSLDDYNQAVAKGQEAWKKWREVKLHYTGSALC